MKKLFLLPLLALSMIGCNQQKRFDSFKRFCDFYNDDYISAYVKTTNDHDVHEFPFVTKSLFAESPFKRDDYNFLYAKISVTYSLDHNFYDLNWLVEYKYNDDFSYEKATDYSIVYYK